MIRPSVAVQSGPVVIRVTIRDSLWGRGDFNNRTGDARFRGVVNRCSGRGVGRAIGRGVVKAASAYGIRTRAKSSPGFCQTHARDTPFMSGGPKRGGEVQGRHARPPTSPPRGGLV